MKRLARLAPAALACVSVAGAAPPIDRVIVTSPDSTLRMALEAVGGRLFYDVNRNRVPLIEPSRAGILVDGVDLGDGVTFGAIENYRVERRYSRRGTHATGVDRANGARVTVTHRASGLRYGVEVRAYDDGAAFRIIVPGEGSRVPDAASAFTFPARSIVWSGGLHDLDEGQHGRQPIEDVPAGLSAAVPLMVKLPDDAGYVAIAESEPQGYSGMVLQATGNRVYRERLAHAPAAVEGRIMTPWRVILAAATLTALGRSDIVHRLDVQQ